MQTIASGSASPEEAPNGGNVAQAPSPGSNSTEHSEWDAPNPADFRYAPGFAVAGGSSRSNASSKSKKVEGHIRKIAGILCIAIAIAAFVASMFFYISGRFPAWVADGVISGDAERYEQNIADIETYQSALDQMERGDEGKAETERHLSICKQELKRDNSTLTSAFMRKTVALPCWVLFILWFVLAIRTRKDTGGLKTRSIVLRTIGFVIGGAIFFWLLPPLLVFFVENIVIPIVLTVVVVAIVWVVMKKSKVEISSYDNLKVREDIFGNKTVYDTKGGPNGTGATVASLRSVTEGSVKLEAKDAEPGQFK